MWREDSYLKTHLGTTLSALSAHGSIQIPNLGSVGAPCSDFTQAITLGCIMKAIMT